MSLNMVVLRRSQIVNMRMSKDTAIIGGSEVSLSERERI